jgi:hypothetical protein
MKLLRSALTALPLALTMIASTARAQTPAAPEALPSTPAAPPAAVQAPPAGYAPPPAGYAPPPAGYAPPPGYAAPPSYGYAARAPEGPATLPYKDGYPIPDGYHPELQMRKGLIIGGAVTFGAMYLIPAAATLTSNDKSLLVPIAGPFIELGHLDFSSGGENHGFAQLAAVVLVIDGLAQTAGAAMLLAGLTTRKEVLVRNDVAEATVRVTPLTMGYGGAGIGIVGTM